MTTQPERKRCAQKLWTMGAFRPHVCPRYALPDSLYCGQHDTAEREVRRKERRAAICHHISLPMRCDRDAVGQDKFGFGYCAEHDSVVLEAKCRLAEAAPDLLIACQIALEWIENGGNRPFQSVSYASSVLREAIKKADGTERFRS